MPQLFGGYCMHKFALGLAFLIHLVTEGSNQHMNETLESSQENDEIPFMYRKLCAYFREEMISE